MSSTSKRERWTNAVIATLTVLAIPAAIVLAGWALVVTVFGADDAPDCSDYTFDQEAWENKEGDDREEEAAALAHCDTLTGMSHAAVAELLGTPNRGRKHPAQRWAYSAGWVNDAIGIGDGQTLRVRFDSSGHVTTASVTYPPQGYD
jgi:hypothetical protein